MIRWTDGQSDKYGCPVCGQPSGVKEWNTHTLITYGKPFIMFEDTNDDENGLFACPHCSKVSSDKEIKKFTALVKKNIEDTLQIAKDYESMAITYRAQLNAIREILGDA